MKSGLLDAIPLLLLDDLLRCLKVLNDPKWGSDLYNSEPAITVATGGGRLCTAHYSHPPDSKSSLLTYLNVIILHQQLLWKNICTYFQFCHQEGGELVTIMDDSKQQDLKRFVKSFVLDAPIESNPSWKSTSEWGLQLYFWIGGHSFLLNLVFTRRSVILVILLAFIIQLRVTAKII